MAQIWATIFFLSLASPVTRYHDQLSSCTTSEKTSNPIMKKRSDGWMYRRKRVISLEHITFFLFFFYLGFLSRTLTNHRTAGEGRGHFFNSSLPLSLASQTLRHQLGDYCREFTSAHTQQPDSNQEPLISERKSLTTKNLNIKKTA